MFEIVSVLVMFLVIFFGFILLFFLLVLKAGQWLFSPVIDEVVSAVSEERERTWKQSEPWQREQIVRNVCAWRIIGRVAGASALVTGACITAAPALAIMWCLAAWRVAIPIKEELRNACAYRSTGRNDEPPYSW